MIKVDDERTDALKKILNEISYVRKVAVEHEFSELKEPDFTYERIIKNTRSNWGQKII